MSEQLPPTRLTAKRDSIRVRLQNLNSASEQRTIGPAEIIGLAGSAVILLLVIVSYLYFLVPARSRLDALQSERARLQTQLRSSQEVVVKGRSTEATVLNITKSLEDFESKKLASANSGRMSLYDNLNLLIRKNGLRNTSGPTYTPLEPAGSKSATGARSANTKWQSIYPGIAISVTVEGQYPNLRRFIQDLETNRQFVIINSVELERATETSSSPPSGEGEPSGSPRGALVSLRLEMATYFQRGSTADAAIPSVAH
ncbi:MAG: GspMb/PilO family protein [Terriglobia bacterium]